MQKEVLVRKLERLEKLEEERTKLLLLLFTARLEHEHGWIKGAHWDAVIQSCEGIDI